MDLVEKNEAKDPSHPWDTPEQVPGVDIVSFGALFDVALELPEEAVVEVEKLGALSHEVVSAPQEIPG